MTRRFNFAVSAFVAFALFYPRSNSLTAQEKTCRMVPLLGPR